jgi:hypothetical protein
VPPIGHRRTSPTPGSPASRQQPSRARPWHVGTFLGLSIGAYGWLLAGVTGAQSTADADLAAARRPAVDTATDLAIAHDRLERALEAASRVYGEAADGYGLVADRLAALDDSLGGLAASVAEAQGAATTLPSRVSLPSVARSIAPTRAPAAPVVHATTGASGG